MILLKIELLFLFQEFILDRPVIGFFLVKINTPIASEKISNLDFILELVLIIIKNL